MSKKAYVRLTTVSLFLIAASAILADRLSQYSLLFGGVAVSCALVSTWIYFKHGMRKVRIGDGDGNRQVDARPEEIAVASTADRPGTSFEALHESLHLNREGLVVSDEPGQIDLAEDRSESFQPTSEMFLGTLSTFQVKSYYLSNIIVRQPQRTFAEEVVGIVRGLTAPGNPMYEFEFKADGSFRVVPCAQRTRRTDEKKRLGENVESIELQNRVH